MEDFRDGHPTYDDLMRMVSDRDARIAALEEQLREREAELKDEHERHDKVFKAFTEAMANELDTEQREILDLQEEVRRLRESHPGSTFIDVPEYSMYQRCFALVDKAIGPMTDSFPGEKISFNEGIGLEGCLHELIRRYESAEQALAAARAESEEWKRSAGSLYREVQDFKRDAAESALSAARAENEEHRRAQRVEWVKQQLFGNEKERP
jgi:DNA repair exonuclease SbcCD ATPase subunit